jgi:[ribosomal protein S5]-alanine N-acetyltransferase
VTHRAEAKQDSRARAALLTTPRLQVRLFDRHDAPFVLELLNEPGWLRYIGNKHVQSVADAERYLEQGPLAMFQRVGFCLYCVERRDDGTPLGMCGLIKRDALDDVDIGFAFLARHGGQGYARESVDAVLAYARSTLGLRRIVAIVTPGNERSINLLRNTGFVWERKLTLAPDQEELDCYVHAP